MRVSWAQTGAGGITIAVVAGLVLLPGRLLGPDPVLHVAVPSVHQARPVEAAPPLAKRHRRVRARAAAQKSAARPLTYVWRPRVVVATAPARRPAALHRAAVISKLAPTAPLARARVLAATVALRNLPARPSSTAKTIAALAASLRKK